VVTAQDGFAALRSLRGAPPDLLITELDLPRMSGFESLSVVRTRFPLIAVIALSGEYTAGHMPQQTVCDAFLTKGPNLDFELIQETQRLISESPLRGSRPKSDVAPVWLPRFVRERVKGLYSSTGRPSIDPEVLLRLLLVGYLYGITSERRLLEEVKMHPAYRWFTRLDFGQEIPDHSTFSKNRHGRFRESGVFRDIFEEIVLRCIAAGLVVGRNLAVDGTLVEANASPQSRVPPEKQAGFCYRSGCRLGQESWACQDGLLRPLPD
jgi:transposase/CheY-like chemotaxis protein